MATITINIPAGVTPRVIDALAGQFGYQAQMSDADGNVTPNPQTKAQFAKQVLINFIKDQVRTYETDVATNISRNQVEADVKNNIALT